MSTVSPSPPAAEPSKRPSDQTWRTSNGIVFPASSSASNMRNRTWNSSLGITFSSQGAPSSTGSRQTRRMHSDGERGGRKASLADEPRQTRRVWTRKSEVSHNSRALSHYAASGDTFFEPAAGCENTFSGGVLQSQSVELGATVGSMASASKPTWDIATRRRGPLDETNASPVQDNEHCESGLAAEQEEAVVCNDQAYYRVSDEVLQEAREAGKYWEYGLYRNAEGRKPMLHYCRKKDASEYAAKKLLEDDVKLVGLDLEWKIQQYRGRSSTAIKDNVSLIQLASESRVVIFHIALHRGDTAEEILAPSLRRILEADDIVKVGVNINADCTRLANFLRVDVRSRFELSHIHKLVLYWGVDPLKINRKLVALDKLVEAHLGLPLYKGEVRTGAWDRELDMAQLVYAASDAYAGLQLYSVLDAKRRALKPTPPMPLPAELRLPIRLAAQEEAGEGADEMEGGVMAGDEANVDGAEDDPCLPAVDESSARPPRSRRF